MSRASEGKTALVTGATSGIGRAAALALANAGWWVVATGRDPDRGEQVGRQLSDRGTFLAGDLGDPSTPQALVDATVERRGRLDALVNNAGVHFLATADTTSPERYT